MKPTIKLAIEKLLDMVMNKYDVISDIGIELNEDGSLDEVIVVLKKNTDFNDLYLYSPIDIDIIKSFRILDEKIVRNDIVYYYEDTDVTPTHTPLSV